MELKIVIVLKESHAIVGIQAPDCDPVLTNIEGDLDAVLQRVPSLVSEANQRWDENPRYPKTDLPEVEPVASSQQSRGRQSVTPKPQSAQTQWF